MVAIAVRAIRRQMGWTREHAAQVMGISVNRLRCIERGQKHLDKEAAEKLCEATGAKMEIFLQESL